MDKIISEIGEYYTEKVKKYGNTSQGVDWNSRESQYLRFRQLMKILGGEKTYRLNDLGCGYGELVNYLENNTGNNYTYHGWDLSNEMIKRASTSFADNSNAEFTYIDNVGEMDVSDYTIASGIFNVKMQFSIEEWISYIFSTLDVMNVKSRRGFSFNMLTAYSDVDKMRDYLFYASPGEIFDHCKQTYSRNVALLHDYDLYEFTILVRKDSN